MKRLHGSYSSPERQERGRNRSGGKAGVQDGVSADTFLPVTRGQAPEYAFSPGKDTFFADTSTSGNSSYQFKGSRDGEGDSSEAENVLAAFSLRVLSTN